MYDYANAVEYLCTMLKKVDEAADDDYANRAIDEFNGAVKFAHVFYKVDYARLYADISAGVLDESAE